MGCLTLLMLRFRGIQTLASAHALCQPTIVVSEWVEPGHAECQHYSVFRIQDSGVTEFQGTSLGLGMSGKLNKLACQNEQ